MGNGKKYGLGSHNFPTQKATHAHVQRILRSYSDIIKRDPHKRPQRLTAEDAHAVWDLVLDHHRDGVGITTNIKCVWVRWHKGPPGQSDSYGFYIEHLCDEPRRPSYPETRKRKEGFSYNACFVPIESQAWYELSEMMRGAVVTQRHAVADAAGLGFRDDIDVDHEAIDFNVIAKAWLRENEIAPGITPDKVPSVEDRDGNRKIAEPFLSSWQRFHAMRWDPVPKPREKHRKETSERRKAVKS